MFTAFFLLLCTGRIYAARRLHFIALLRENRGPGMPGPYAYGIQI